MIYAILALCAACELALVALMAVLCYAVCKRREAADSAPDEPTEGGMDLLLLKKKPVKRKAKRFTDKSRAWITAHEEATRR